MKSIIQNEVEVAVVNQTTNGKKGSAGKSFFTLDFETLIAYRTEKVTGADGKESETKVEDYAATGVNIGKFFKGFASAISFLQSDFDKAQVSGQVTTPANSKTPKTLTDDEKRAFLSNYVATINELTRQRSGLKSEMARANKAMAEFMRNPANLTAPDFTARITALATRVAELQAKIDAEDSE